MVWIRATLGLLKRPAHPPAHGLDDGVRDVEGEQHFPGCFHAEAPQVPIRPRHGRCLHPGGLGGAFVRRLPGRGGNAQEAVAQAPPRGVPSPRQLQLLQASLALKEQRRWEAGERILVILAALSPTTGEFMRVLNPNNG